LDRQSHHLLLRAPAPTRQSLSFCDASVRGVTGWLAGLPKANIGETARQLYQALIELNQLRIASETRLQLLELLRPDVQFVCTQLEKHYVNQPIVLSERPRKVAGLCQALQNHLAVGYKLIVVRVVAQPERDRQQLLSVALQRAIHSLGALLIRSTQLYGPAAPGLWLELHQLYQLAVEQGTERLLIRDPLARHAQGLSAEQSYLASLLLGCARCNQMRQQSIVRLAAALEAWSAMTSVQAANVPSSLFLFSPVVDGPPRYRSLFQGREQQNLLGIDTSTLVEVIDEHLRLAADNRQLTRLPAAMGLDDDLLRHLSSAWGAISERTFQRIPAQGTEGYLVYRHDCTALRACRPTAVQRGARVAAQLQLRCVQVAQWRGGRLGQRFRCAKQQRRAAADARPHRIRQARPSQPSACSPRAHCRQRIASALGHNGKLSHLPDPARGPQPRRLLPGMGGGSAEPATDR